jgi:hypothetical protein
MNWCCKQCTFANYGGSRCEICGGPRESLVECRTCTFLNDSARSTCEICGSSVCNAASSKKPEYDALGSSSSDDDDSFELAKRSFSQFAEEINDKNGKAYRCLRDGKLLASRNLMCAYIAKKFRGALLDDRKRSTTLAPNPSTTDYDVALQLALADYDDVVESVQPPKTSSVSISSDVCNYDENRILKNKLGGRQSRTQSSDQGASGNRKRKATTCKESAVEDVLRRLRELSRSMAS